LIYCFKIIFGLVRVNCDNISMNYSYISHQRSSVLIVQRF